MAVHRLSPFNIEDSLARGRLVKEIREPQEEWPRYEVLEEEAYRPDLIAYRHYGTEQATQIVLAAAGIDNAEIPIEIGSQIPLPPAAWLRQRIRFYQDQ